MYVHALGSGYIGSADSLGVVLGHGRSAGASEIDGGTRVQTEHCRSMGVSVRCVCPAIRRVSVRGYVGVVEGSGYISVGTVFVCCWRVRVHSRVQGYIQAWPECGSFIRGVVAVGISAYVKN